ncbi:hypothetical protein CAPTEDRAFT_108989 [Capitella teleta]|uniref:tRNA (cytosine(38)-C(5))-methyltransferase n=1 Tax=Capitella teleta TaxID=283909 RepID=R7VAP8_CAPTE|nr:hypothetical protein CAPTEDRAFT_108989 [Capitella teleta]|eukprot:ELU13416.1 hypothetical protein CAPTEDRAFT_108989 [Capitella teleta]
MGDPLRVLELFSGIGGMHYALQETGINHEVIAAADINTVANDIYKHNFPDCLLMNRCIESIQLSEFSRLRPDLITMSPPCQPFTRVGKQRDIDDPRTKSFLHLLKVISTLERSVKYIFVENVKGFDGSEAHRMLLETLQAADYVMQEFLISPLQCGIPNSRLRYYLMAKKKPLKFQFDTTSQIMTELPACAASYLNHCQSKPDSTASSSVPLYDRCAAMCRPLSSYLQEDMSHDLLPEKFVHRFWVMDIVKPSSTNSCCFTKRYGHHIEGAGSVLQTNTDCEIDLTEYKKTKVYTAETEAAVKQLGLRFFSPREIANLMHFPAHFSFPANFSTVQTYRVLGNSLNVHVVAVLMKLMLIEK